MKKLIILSLSLFYTLSLDAQTVSTHGSTLEWVTVYENGANFNRTASIGLASGEQTIIFQGLPINLEPSSVQIGSSKRLEIISIQVANTPFEQRSKPVRFNEIVKEMEQNQLKISELDSRIDGLILEASILDQNTRLGGNQGFSLADLQQIAGYSKIQKEKNSREQAEVKRAIAKLQESQNKLQQEMAEIRQEISRLSAEVKVKLKSPQAQQVNFSLDYSLYSNASWQNTYNLSFADLDQSLGLQHKAIIYQSTGEDWKNVNLILATGTPSSNLTMPSLRPQFVNFIYRGRGARADNIVLQEVEIASVAGQAAGVTSSNANKGYYTQVSLQQMVNRIEYRPKDRLSLKSGDSETIVVRELDLEASYIYQSTPSLDPNVYLMAKLNNWEQHQLQAGEISIYNQGQFVGSLYGKFEASSDSLLIPLGKDDYIQIERERIFSKESTSFLGGDKIEDYEYRITVSNRKSQELQIRIFDQIPISQNEEIKIKSEYKSAKLNSEQGIIFWDLKLASKAAKELEFSYQIRYPKDRQINW